MRSNRPASPISASSPSRSRSKEGAIAVQLQYARDEAPDGDRLGVNFAGSLLLHGLVAAFIVGWAFFFHHRTSNWGENASTVGAIQATMVASIPLPPTQRTLDTGVLTSEAPSPAPVTEKEKTEAAPTPDSLAISGKDQASKSCREADAGSAKAHSARHAISDEGSYWRNSRYSHRAIHGTAQKWYVQRFSTGPQLRRALRLLRQHRQQQGFAELVQGRGRSGRFHGQEHDHPF